VTVYDSLGGRQGAVVADHLADTGHAVTFVTPLGQAMPNLAASRDWGKVYGRLRRLGVGFATDRELVSIGEAGAVFRDLYTKAEHVIAGDSVVLVLGSQADDRLYRDLKAQAAPGRIVTMIGDCVAPRRASDAIREGELAARALFV
jgi:hypothetical protein